MTYEPGQPAAKRQPEPPPVTGCPQCGSDDYSVEWKPDGSEPDYDNGLKKCQECGEEWV